MFTFEHIVIAALANINSPGLEIIFSRRFVRHIGSLIYFRSFASFFNNQSKPLLERIFRHSRPQSPRSFWPVAGIESSGLVQHRKSAIHGLIVKSSKSDWLRIRNEYSAHAQKIGSRQSSRSLPQARRIVGSGDENDLSRVARFVKPCAVRNEDSSYEIVSNLVILVPRGRAPFGQHQESRPLARSNDIPVLNGFVNTID